MNGKTVTRSSVILGLMLLARTAAAGPIPPGPTGNFINNSAAPQTGSQFNVSSGTIRETLTVNKLILSTITAADVTATTAFHGPATYLTGVPLTALSAGTLPTSVVASSVAASGASAGIYGGPTQSAQFRVGSDGRLISVTQYAIPGVSTDTVTTDRSFTWTKYQNFLSSISVGSIYGDGTNLTGVALSSQLTSTASALTAEIARATARENDLGVSTGTIQSSLSSVILSTGALSDRIDGKVAKAGDTMTGQLTISGSSLTVRGALAAQYYQIAGSTVLAMNGSNLKVGTRAGESTTGNFNTYVGHTAGNGNVAGVSNAYVGYQAGLYSNGSYNIGIGQGAGAAFEATGGRNIFVGVGVGANALAASSNVVVGHNSGASIVSGSGNVVIGYNTDLLGGIDTSNQLNIAGLVTGVIGGSSVTAHGAMYANSFHGAGSALTGVTVDLSTVTSALAGKLSNTETVPGGLINLSTYTFGGGIPYAGATDTFRTAYQITTSSNISANAYQIAGSTVLAYKGSALVIGANAGKNNTGTTNMWIGDGSAPGVTNATLSMGIGLQALGAGNNIGARNHVVGYQAGYNMATTGSDNTCLGYLCGYGGAYTLNTAVGASAGNGWERSDRNSYFGASSGYNGADSQDNTAVGHQAGLWLTSSNGNTCIGAGSCTGSTYLNGYPHNGNTAVGYRSGYSVTVASANVFIGYRAGYSVTAGTGNIIIGALQDAPTAGTSNYLNIGGAIIGSLSASPALSSVTVVGAFSAGSYIGLPITSTAAIVSQLTAQAAALSTAAYLGNVQTFTAAQTMSGPLTLSGSSLTVTGNAFSVGTTKLAVTTTGVGISTLPSTSAMLSVVGADDNGTPNIARFTTANQGVALGIGYNGIYSLGTGASIDISMVAKGSGYLWLSRGSAGSGVRVAPTSASNTIYMGAASMGISADSGQTIAIGKVSAETSGLVVETTNNRVGIGTNTPYSALLDVRGNIATSGQFISTGTGNNFYKGPAYFSAGATLVGIADASNAILGSVLTSFSNATYLDAPINDVGSDIIFRTSGASERMRITRAGLVGIGNTNPSVALDVTGVINSSTTASILAAFQGNNSNWSRITVKNNSATNPILSMYAYPASALSTNGYAKIDPTFDSGNIPLVLGSGTGSTSRIGIGNVNPSTSLHVSSGTLTVDGTGAGIELSAAATPAAGWQIGSSKGYYAINATNAALSSGTIVHVSISPVSTFASIKISTTDANSIDPVGTIFDTSCAAGTACKICDSGLCPMLLASGSACAATAEMGAFTGSEVGRGQCATGTSAALHFQEVGNPITFSASNGAVIWINAHRN